MRESLIGREQAYESASKITPLADTQSNLYFSLVSGTNRTAIVRLVTARPRRPW
jgi:hypothetical protein